MDLQGNFLDVNRGTEELTGYGREELIGKIFRLCPCLMPGKIRWWRPSSNKR